MDLHYEIPADDLAHAGEASSRVKKKLVQLGIDPVKIKSCSIDVPKQR